MSCDVTDCAALEALWSFAKSTFGVVDIWVNNAGVNSPDKPVYELTGKEISFLLVISVSAQKTGHKKR
jgi:NADP-dependent 3-hydroxy acid dehydrogenase YdfG